MPAMAGDTPDYIPAATPSTVSQKPSDTVTVAKDGMGSKHTWRCARIAARIAANAMDHSLSARCG